LCQEISGHSQGETNEALKSLGRVGKKFAGLIDKISAGDEKLHKRMERVKGIEPSYSAWKSGNPVVFSVAVLTFSVVLAH
jgi:hypothetical protein